MKRLLILIFDHSFSSCKRHKIFTIILSICAITGIVLGIIAGIQIHNGIFPQDFSNIGYVKYLRDKLGFVGFIFSELFSIFVFLLIEVLSLINIWFSFVGVLFFIYFCYSKTVTIVSITVDFGFFNTVILLIFLVIVSLIYFYLFILFMIECFDSSGCNNYIPTTLRLCLPILAMFVLTALLTAIFLMVLKNFVFVLVYK